MTGVQPGGALPRPGRCAVLGILNVTPDSFSDGGRFLDIDAAVDHGLMLDAAGADLVDIGGESTRPGAGRVDPADELARVLPVVHDLVGHGVPVSIDTTRASVAEAAIDLEPVDRQALQTLERRVAGSEVVDHQTDACSP